MKQLKALAIVGIATMVMLMAFMPLAMTVKADSPWYNDNWAYRMPYTITNGGSIANTIVRVDLNDTNGFTVANANADGSDIRFVLNDQTTVCEYWLEYWKLRYSIPK